LLANLDVEGGFTNGTRGIVYSLKGGTVGVQFESGQKDVGVHYFKQEYKGLHYIRAMIPLKLAFATSIHKSQSLTLSSVQIDIGSDVFTEGQSYVALSRCKSLEGLYITKLDCSKIKPNAKALKFEKQFLKLAHPM